jgi:hypothetical protein
VIERSPPLCFGRHFAPPRPFQRSPTGPHALPALRVRGLPGGTGALVRVALLIDPGEISTQSFHGEFFRIDFLSRSYPATAKKRHRRAPVPGGVLQKKGSTTQGRIKNFRFAKRPNKRPPNARADALICSTRSMSHSSSSCSRWRERAALLLPPARKTRRCVARSIR